MLRVVDLGRIGYLESLCIQKAVQQQRILGQCDDTLLLLEHPSVLTKGIRTDENNILLSKEELSEKDITVYETSRGGDVTYLGPGQVVGYIIMNIDGKEKGIRTVVKKIEQVTINILKKEFNIDAHTEDKKYTGVFVGNAKITALGIAVNRRVTMHGFALNVNTDLKPFEWIIPCGLRDRGVTSIEKLIGRKYNAEKIKKLIKSEFETLFQTSAYEIDKNSLFRTMGDDINETGMVKNQRFCY